MKLLVIENLSAGNSGATIHDFCRALAKDGDDIDMRFTDGRTRIEDLVADARDFDAVVASGGDGTVSSVAYALSNTGVPLLPFPSGTANLLATNLDEPLEPYAFAKILRRMDILPFDVGEIELGRGRRGFMMMAGAGYDAEIMADAVRLKNTLGENAYYVAALAKPNPTISEFMLDLDGTRIHTQGIAVLLVNFGRIQFDLSVTPGNNPLDGLLEVVVIKSSGGLQLLPALLAAMRDREGNFPTRGSGMEIFKAREIYIESDPVLPVQYDGEPADMMTPIRARALPRAINMIVDNTSARIAGWRRLFEQSQGGSQTHL